MSELGSEAKFGKESGEIANSAGIEPDWTTGLKKLYNSVVDEPLPDTFKNLLAQLDQEAGNK